MPLNEGAINEILPFAAEGLVDAGDVLSPEDYKNHQRRLRGHMVGIALRELQNTEARQATHIAAGVAQFIANRYAPGVRDDGDLDKVEKGLLTVITGLIQKYAPVKYELCEFYNFRHPEPMLGFYPRTGGIIEGAALRHPEAWEKLKTAWGQKLCVTKAKWQEMNVATWATLADGTKVGWNGIGGVPFYAPDWDTGDLRLPDTRGMFGEDAGFDSLDVGGVHGDAIRNINGNVGYLYSYSSSYVMNGAFYQSNSSTQPTGNYGNIPSPIAGFLASRVVPTAAKNQPRAWGSLACVYLGPLAS